MTPKIGDRVTMRAKLPTDKEIVNLGDAVYERVGAIIKIEDDQVTVEYDKVTHDELDSGASQ